MNFLRWKKAQAESPSAGAALAPGPGASAPEPPAIIADRVDPWTGLTDAMMAGWFRNDTAELYTGFAVSAADIVADIGCGDGSNAAFCARLGARIILADIDPNCIAEATARLNGQPGQQPFDAHVTDCDPLPIAAQTCTRVICTEVIEHVPSPEKLLAELFRIGRPGARYLISCPDPTVEYLYKKIAHPSYFEPPNHVRIIERDELDRLAENAGLIVESRTSYGFYWTMWWALFWACEASVEAPRHPVLDNWSRTWKRLLDQPDGYKIKNALDELMPKSQIIIARKP